jgi:D-alanine--D-alanine ligase
MKIAVLCGGPSPERGISLNSSRSVLDHLSGDGVTIVPFYFDSNKRPYKISPAQLYSNTPSDFDFKLATTAKPLTNAALISELRKVDIVFPVMHGAYGEDGGIQEFLEKKKIPYVGSDSKSCKRAFDKFLANEEIRRAGFYAPPSIAINKGDRGVERKVRDFFTKNAITRAVVKPATGGSSIGVFSVGTPEDALTKIAALQSSGSFDRVVVEPFAQGREFTVIIVQNRFNQPVAILPTEIETDYSQNQIFDYRKKYLPTRQVTYHCPPRFSLDTIEQIQVQAEQIFTLFGMRDFARYDGWVLPDGNIWFSDFNPISGMEQNSFFFQQGSRIGLSHRGILQQVVSHALSREGLTLPTVRQEHISRARKPVHVLFGGPTSERQVSLMSGTNVWLKLRRSHLYEPKPFLLDTEGSVWSLPYALTLNHTVEEIVENCKHAEKNRDHLEALIRRVHLKLALGASVPLEPYFIPSKYTMEQFLEMSPYVFLALHGGQGEDGTLQHECEKRDIKHNGPSAKVSRLCMDKYETAKFIRELKLPGVTTARGSVVSPSEIPDATVARKLWDTLVLDLGSPSLIVKPRGDGCSSGIVRLFSADDLAKYISLVRDRAPRIPPHTFPNQNGIVEMPLERIESLLFEEFIETDKVVTKDVSLDHQKRSGWIEVTVGVVQRGRHLKVLNPSLTVAEGEVLSLEEKFQGGTGVNITPPPESIVPKRNKERAMILIGKVASALGIDGYSRIDAFLHCATGDIKVIEVNTLPGLTPSTVLYHQALAEKPQLFPRDLLEMFVENKGY